MWETGHVIGAGTLFNTMIAQAAPASVGGIVSGWKETAALVMVVMGLTLLIITGVSMWRRRFRDPLSRGDWISSPMVTEVESAASPSLGEDARPPAISGFPPPTAALSEAQQLLAFMNRAEDTSARLGSELDLKITTIRGLLEQTEGMIQRLEAASKTLAAEQAAMHTALSAARRAMPEPAMTIVPEPSPAVPSPHAVQHVHVPVPQHVPSVEPKIVVQPGAARALERPTAGEAAVQEADPLTAEIYRLADQGLSHIDVARRLNQHVGKVELILALRP